MIFGARTRLTGMITQATPYLFFDGDAARAIEFYRTALDARVEGLQTFAQIPGHTPAPEHAHRVIHALLRLGTSALMISDTQPGTTVPSGDTRVQVALEFDDDDELTRRFDALAAGGQVTMPLHPAFWGARFGAVTDAFGVCWMLTGPRGAAT